MLSRLLIVIFICFCATSSFAAFEIIKPDGISDADNWDSTGSGATKTIRITDQTDGNYIFILGTIAQDRYTLGDLTATDVDEVDSVVLGARWSCLQKRRKVSAGDRRYYYFQNGETT